MKALSIIFVLIIRQAYSQESVMTHESVTLTDSIEISQTFNRFINLIEKKDKKQVLTILLPQIDCIMCFENPEMYDEAPLISAENFYDDALKSFTKSPVYNALKQRSFRIWKITHSNYKPISLPKEYPKDLTLYEIWITTFLENEWAQGHEGQVNIFQFVGVGGNFKLYGTTSIP